MSAIDLTKVLRNGQQPISGIVTNSAISEEFHLTGYGQLNLRIDIETTGTTIVGSITAKLQHRSPGGTYVDLVGANASVAITADGSFSIRQNKEVAADQPNMPIHKQCRVVLTTTNAGDAVTIAAIWVQQAH